MQEKTTLINEFKSLKSLSNNLSLNTESMTLFKSLFEQCNVKKTPTNKIKNIINKVNSILNKLSNKNIDKLVIEFIDSVGNITPDTYDEILKVFYLKMLNDANFIEIYFDFFMIIISVYKKVCDYNIKHFCETVESKFKIDYCELKIQSGKSVGNFSKNQKNFENNENHRLNNLKIIKLIVKNNLMKKELIDFCDNAILNQKYFIIDIYHWFNGRTQLSSNVILSIKQLLNNNLESRDNILLNELLNKANIKN